ncbi:MAG: A/G-specific adenine glycosylase, partial [Cyclobacteriaceae bacterium]
MNIPYFTENLLQWYPENKRNLPWRNTNDPYIIWLSEIILQQTRVAQGLPYFDLFLEKFPTIFDLAKAPESEVLRAWQGLGYYSRARNLHRCAQDIVSQYQGVFPDNYMELTKLTGIGTYTAAAIASFAYKEKIAVLDGNVFRVLSRFFGIKEDISSSKGKKSFQILANKIIPSEVPDTYNQAIMEFGALQCVPKNPDCACCPLQLGCWAYHHKMVSLLPLKNKKTKTRERYFIYFHIRCGDWTVINKREKKDIWNGLVDFPLKEVESYQELLEATPENMSGVDRLREIGAVFDFENEKPRKH